MEELSHRLAVTRLGGGGGAMSVTITSQILQSGVVRGKG